MNKKDFAHEVGMVSAIISDTIMKRFYEKNGQGYCAVVDQIADWAMEFVKKHKNTDWEVILFDGALKPLSKRFKGDIICWDDCVIDFAEYKLQTYNK